MGSHALQSQVMEPLMRSLATGLVALAADLGPLLARTSIVAMTEFGRRVGEKLGPGRRPQPGERHARRGRRNDGRRPRPLARSCSDPPRWPRRRPGGYRLARGPKGSSRRASRRTVRRPATAHLRLRDGEMGRAPVPSSAPRTYPGRVIVYVQPWLAPHGTPSLPLAWLDTAAINL